MKGVSVAKELALLAVLLMACGLVTAGVAMWSVPAAFILGGVALAGVGVLFLRDVGEPE